MVYLAWRSPNWWDACIAESEPYESCFVESQNKSAPAYLHITYLYGGWRAYKAWAAKLVTFSVD